MHTESGIIPVSSVFPVVAEVSLNLRLMSASDAGSPFQFTVGPITDGGAHKVRAIGPGLERGEVNKPSTSIR